MLRPIRHLSPLALVRDLPIRIKLAATVAGALLLLAGVSLFALDRLDFVTTLQRNAAAQSAIQQQVQQALLTAQELRVIAREVTAQQTVMEVRKALKRASSQTALVAADIDRINDASDQSLLDTATARLQALAQIVTQAGALRTDLLTIRRKRLFQVRPVFESAVTELTEEIGRGKAAEGGVASVRDDAAKQSVDDRNPAVQAVTRYRLTMSRLQAAALLFLATSNGSAANDVRDAASDADAAMRDIMASPVPDAVKADAHTVDTIGRGIATTSVELIGLTRKLDQVAGSDGEAASEAMRAAFGALAQAARRRESEASRNALAAGGTAALNIKAMISGIAALMLLLGAAVTWSLSTPIRRLAGIVQAIANGRTDQPVPFTEWHDEIGGMARAIDTLRGVMRQSFVQNQMIEQLPVGVMTAEPQGDCRITYLNKAAREVLEPLRALLPRTVDSIEGQSMDIFHSHPERQRAVIGDPARLPFRARFSIGPETLEVQVSALRAQDGSYVGPLVIWRSLTGQVTLERQFEQTVGQIARTVLASAETMRSAAEVLRHSAASAHERTVAVAAASDQATNSVNAVAAGAEELAASVADIGRQMGESTQIAGFAVAEAKTTDRSVSGLSQAAARIKDVVRLISDIASRTNLLALNATIEAARAGEAGKGFAVVATEVKNLALQTGRATGEISSQIAAIQAATSEAVKALQSIGETIERMNEITVAVAGAISQQYTATQSITEAVQQAAAGTLDVNSNITAVSAVVDETGSKAEAVLSAATAMATQAAVLQREVAGFLVSVQQAA